MREMYKAAGIMPEVYDFCESIEKSLEERFKAIDTVAEYNQLKVVMAMQGMPSYVRISPAELTR